MELYRKRKSDDEYVEAIRKRVALSRWFGIFSIGVGIFLVVMCLIWGLPWKMVSMLDFMGDAAPEIRNGIIIGFGAAFQIVFVVWCFGSGIAALKSHRTERLLLKFYDELHKIREDDQQDSQ